MLAVATVGTLAIAGTSATTVAGSGGLSSTLSSALRSKLVKGQKSASKGNRGAAWKDLGLKENRKRLERYGDCVVNSYGQVNEFFLRTPCRSLRRVLFRVGDGKGNSIIVSVSWVQMYTTSAARELKSKADKDGTGNVRPLPEQLVGVNHVEWSGEYYGSRRSGRMTTIAEAEPVDGSPDPTFVDVVAEVASYLPRP